MAARPPYALPLSVFLFTVNASASDAVDFAASLIGRPYVWGAEGPNAFDCSGLTQYVYQEFGIDLPRRAINQSDVGDRIGARQLRRGDLVFFSSDTGRSLVTHVGIYEGRGVMIDASKRHGRVRRDDLNDSYWVDRFMFGRRIDGVELARNDDDADDPRDRGIDRRDRPERSRDRRRAAIQVIERVAGALLRRPRR